jgi:hypothetical protein
MPKLSDTQAILLVHAAQHQDGRLYPLPQSLTECGGRLDSPIAALLKRSLLEERETTDQSATYRTDGDARFGLFITSSGLAAVNISDERDEETSAPSTEAPSPARQSKSEQVKSLLTRPNGVTLPELMEVTGWLPHSTRAALTGLRKKGLSIERFSRDGTTCYRSVSAA